MGKEPTIFQVPGVITSIKTMTKSLRITMDTQETLNAEEYKRLFELHNKLGWFTFNIHRIDAEDIIDLPAIKVKQGVKSPSLRFKQVLFRKWEQDNFGFEEFEDYYLWYMEKLIEQTKEQLT